MGMSWKDKGRRDKWDRYDNNKNNKKSKKKWNQQDYSDVPKQGDKWQEYYEEY